MNKLKYQLKDAKGNTLLYEEYGNGQIVLTDHCTLEALASPHPQNSAADEVIVALLIEILNLKSAEVRET